MKYMHLLILVILNLMTQPSTLACFVEHNISSTALRLAVFIFI